MSSLLPYVYDPLDEQREEIRLLKLLPGTFESEVHVLLDIVPFTKGSDIRFEALSYTWGSPKDKAKIQIGQNKHCELAVTRSLAEALPYLRYETKPRVLWIDAICVDQQNVAERSSQVKRMAGLYTKAERVVIWIGPASSNSNLALDILSSIGSKIAVDWFRMSIAAASDPPTESHWGDTGPQLGFKKQSSWRCTASCAVHGLSVCRSGRKCPRPIVVPL
jgi:hypothetical protein